MRFFTVKFSAFYYVLAEIVKCTNFECVRELTFNGICERKRQQLYRTRTIASFHLNSKAHCFKEPFLAQFRGFLFYAEKSGFLNFTFLNKS